nr:hypothetical protein [Candidatus Undinarchaeales archaeon ERR594346 U_76725]
MQKLDEQILNIIRNAGPSTPMEIASRINGTDSLIVGAVLADAASQKKIKKSKRRIGGGLRYYYFPDQFGTLQKKISSSLTTHEKEVLQILMKENLLGEFEISNQIKLILPNLEDLIRAFNIEHGGTTYRCWSAPTMDEKLAFETAMEKITGRVGSVEPEVAKVETAEKKIQEVKKEEPAAKIEKPKEEEKPEAKIQEKSKPASKVAKKSKTSDSRQIKLSKEDTTQKETEEEMRDRIRKEILREIEGDFGDIVLRWLETQDIDVRSENSVPDENTYELDVKVPTPLGRQTYMVKILDFPKKPASQNDVAAIGTEAVTRRVPAMVISSTGFAKTAIK